MVFVLELWTAGQWSAMDRFPYPAAGRAVYMLLKRLADERDVGVLCSAAEGHGTPTDHHAGRHRLPSFLPSFLRLFGKAICYSASVMHAIRD